MQRSFKLFLFCALGSTVIAATTNFKPKPAAVVTSNKADKVNQQKIQVAILLDVSNSMDGLIEQAKTQLWNMVNTLSKVHCSDNLNPSIEIALYEYGRSSNDVNKGYVKRINGFITNLDSLSMNLFKLTTNGGDEYCGQVIYSSLNELQWDESADNYKVIFIAGNEDFLQGKLNYIKACNLAKTKGVIVNTIYCGNKADGIAEHWNLNAECGNGTFTNINQNQVIEEIPTPYDSTIYAYNSKLNGTYIGYGSTATYNWSNVTKADQMNAKSNFSGALKRVKVKAMGNVYKNSNWDMVDASKDDEKFLEKVDKKDLPDSLKNKTKEELKAIVDKKQAERNVIQEKINTLSKQREDYIAKYQKNKAGTQTLETEIDKIISEQVKRFKMYVK